MQDFDTKLTYRKFTDAEKSNSNWFCLIFRILTRANANISPRTVYCLLNEKHNFLQSSPGCYFPVSLSKLTKNNMKMRLWNTLWSFTGDSYKTNEGPCFTPFSEPYFYRAQPLLNQLYLVFPSLFVIHSLRKSHDLICNLLFVSWNWS